MLTTDFIEALREDVSVLQAQHPVLANVLSRAHALVHDGHVFVEEDGHSAMVRSSTDADRWYHVNGSCPCDASHFEKAHPCKHRTAVRLYERVSERLAEDRIGWAPTLPPASAPAGLDPQFLIRVHGKPFVRYAGLLALAHQRGLQELRVAWTYNDAELSLAEATAVFPFGTYQEAGDASPSNVKQDIAPSFRRMALTRAAARVLRNALAIDACAVEELADHD